VRQDDFLGYNKDGKFIDQYILKSTMVIMGTTNNLETQANGRIMTIILGKPSIRLIPCSSQLEKI